MALLLSAMTVAAQGIRFNDEQTDTTRITELLDKAIAIKDAQERVAEIAKEFIGTPYEAGTLESADGEQLTINLSHVDCTTFVDNVMAIAITAGEGRCTWQDFVYNLGNIRYRGGEINGYASRLHYISDWVVDNTHRGNFAEVTGDYTDVSYAIKTLDYMTRNRNLYPALKDDETYAKVKSYEIGYRNHRFPYIKATAVGRAAKSFLKSGDIIAITTSQKDLDVVHMGIVLIEGKTAKLLHASSKQGAVVIDQLPLDKYLEKYRHSGIRVFRITE